MPSVAPTFSSTVRVGSGEHRRLLADFFIDSHIEFDPQAIEWPGLDEPTCTRLRRLPFWQEAVSTEGMTSHTVTLAAALEPDPHVRRAIALQGHEEQRHAQLLQALTAHFRIAVTVPLQPPSSDSLEHDFLFAGFGECFDSFFAFGLFKIAGSSGYFPVELVRIFEPVVQEEARHILFFVNWVKYRRLQLPWWRRPLFRLRCGWIILQQIASRVRTARTLSGSADDGSGGAANAGIGNTDNFTLSAHQDLGESITLRRLLQLCLQENERRLAPYDARLLRPRLVPTLATWVYRVLCLLP